MLRSLTLRAVEALGVGALDDLVVHVGEVVDVGDGVAEVLEVAAHDLARQRGADVADVRLVLHRHAAHVHADACRLSPATNSRFSRVSVS